MTKIIEIMLAKENRKLIAISLSWINFVKIATHSERPRPKHGQIYM